MTIRFMSMAAKAMSCTALVAGLFALSPSTAMAGDAEKDFGNGVFSPSHGVICDRQAGFCADGTGISMSFTEQYLGADAAHKFTKMHADGNFDDQEYTLMNGMHCSTQKQKCFKTKFGTEVTEHLTKRLFR